MRKVAYIELTPEAVVEAFNLPKDAFIFSCKVEDNGFIRIAFASEKCPEVPEGEGIRKVEVPL